MFDAKKFKNTKYTPRTDIVSVPSLADFFDKDEKPEWKVRNLTGAELGLLDAVSEKYKQFNAASKALSGTDKEKVKAFKTLFGINEGLTPETARRTEAVIIGSVEPKCDAELASLIRDRTAGDFKQIADKIYILTGLGAEPGKQKGSGKKQTSESV